MLSKLTMKACSVYFVISLLVLVSCSAIPKPGEHKDRVVDHKLSDHDHGLDDDDDEHEHNPEYDHDAFLGKDEAKNFDDLTPEESKSRLAVIVDKIDKDSNGIVTPQELKDWIQYVQKRYITSDAETLWKEHDTKDGALMWEAYKNRQYPAHETDEEDSNKQMIERDEKRWKAADVNGDGKLDLDEFANFQHPEDAPHMKDLVVEETMQDIDKDGDGFVSLEEFISDMYPDKEEEEPEWVAKEKEGFHEHRDKNKDGKLDKEEVKEWILPADYDHAEAETKHLINEADGDKDGNLSKDEILEKYDLFVGSQATDFGEALTKHDEF